MDGGTLHIRYRTRLFIWKNWNANDKLEENITSIAKEERLGSGNTGQLRGTIWLAKEDKNVRVVIQDNSG